MAPLPPLATPIKDKQELWKEYTFTERFLPHMRHIVNCTSPMNTFTSNLCIRKSIVRTTSLRDLDFQQRVRSSELKSEAALDSRWNASPSSDFRLRAIDVIMQLSRFWRG